MEDHSRLKLNSENQQYLENTETATRGRQWPTLHDRFKPKKPTSSGTDVSHQNVRSIRDISPKHSGNFLKQHRRAMQDDELVKYMSNLPSYLERGVCRQDKVLNFGVLDWGRLEKWQCSQKQILQRSSWYSMSSGHSSSSLSTEGSSVNTSSGQSSSSTNQRLHRPSLQSHLMSPTAQIQEAKSFGYRIQKVPHVQGSQISNINKQEKSTGTGKLLANNFSEDQPDRCIRKNTDPKISVESEAVNGENFEALQKIKVKTNARGGRKSVNKLQVQGKVYSSKQDVSIDTKRAVLQSTDLPQSILSQFSESTTLDYREADVRGRSFSEISESSPVVGSSNVPRSCPLICENKGCTEVKWCFSDAESTGFLSNSCQSVPDPVKKGISESRGRVPEIKSSGVTPIIPTPKVPSTGLELEQNKTAAEKPRSTSPLQRLSFSMGKISKSFSSKEESALPPLNTTHTFANSASANAMAPSCHNTSCDMQDAMSRARSSPLRRLLDPLLKPKASNCHPAGEPLHKSSASTERAHRLARGQVDLSTRARQPGTIKLDLASCREVNIDNSFHEKKRNSSVFQAFLQVAVKNAQPLFTFAVGSERNILAATIKKLSSSREDDYNCIYTFYSVKELRKKNGRWISQSGKEQNHGYIPNAVAQLKVSGSQVSQYFIREFVLFSVDLKEAEAQTFSLQANDELAAIVVKVPNIINKSKNDSDVDRTSKCDDFLELSSDPLSGEDCIFNSRNLVSTTVILPSDVHSLPNKGRPSSLIQRWRSEGSCDCGGWDLGCKLGIYVNDGQHVKKSISSKACAVSDKFELVSQGGDENKKRVFSLAPFKDGIYSVEFTSPVSILQAFSLCIAVIDSKKQWATSESSNLIESKTSLETILEQNDGIKAAPNSIDSQLPARYISNPPLSPFGRV